MSQKTYLREDWKWFVKGRYGLFIHWGPYAMWGRGEQVLFRDLIDQSTYESRACRWNPQQFDARCWAKTAKKGGFRYAVLTARHHDGYCLWDSQLTDYTASRQAPQRDFVAEYIEAFRAEGLRIGLYYSLADWRIPAYWKAASDNPEEWHAFRQYVHGQVRELLTQYGPIDVLWFDGCWPHSAKDWASRELLDTIRSLQPSILVNNRLDTRSAFEPSDVGAVEDAGFSKHLGDFGTPEHQIMEEAGRLWESCQVSTHRLWGWADGEHWRSSEVLLEFLCESVGKGGNLLLNVGPDAHGKIPEAFAKRSSQIGDWLRINGEAIYATQAGTFCDATTRGYQTCRDNVLYLIMRFWPNDGMVRVPQLATPIQRAELLGSGDVYAVIHEGQSQVVTGLPREKPRPLFPVIKLTCADRPVAHEWAKYPLWSGDPRRMLDWVNQRTGGFHVSR